MASVESRPDGVVYVSIQIIEKSLSLADYYRTKQLRRSAEGALYSETSL